MKLIAQGDRHLVRTGGYDAVVEADGYMTSLSVAGEQFLVSDVTGARGAYFSQGRVPKLPQVTQDGPATLSAEGDKAAITYDFAADRVTVKVTNLTTAAAKFYCVLDRAVTATADERDAAARTPVERGATGPTFFRDRVKLRIRGATRLWGLWRGSYQVWETALPAKAAREVVFVPGRMTAEDTQQLRDLPATTNAADLAVKDRALTLVAATDYQVVQRRTVTEGHVVFSGRAKRTPTRSR